MMRFVKRLSEHIVLRKPSCQTNLTVKKEQLFQSLDVKKMLMDGMKSVQPMLLRRIRRMRSSSCIDFLSHFDLGYGSPYIDPEG